MIIKNTFKKIAHSFGRFMSLVLIILIGVGFYAGIKQATPAIHKAEDEFIAEHNMMDIHVVGPLGFTKDDIKSMKKLTSVDLVSGGYSKYCYSGDNVVRVMSIDDLIDRYELYEGERPWNNYECLADKNHYNVGDIITITESVDADSDNDKSATAKSDEDKSNSDKSDEGKSDNDKSASNKKNNDSSDDDSNDDDDQVLTEHRFVVTGTVVSPIYLGKDMGTVSMGNGELYSYILVKPETFDLDVYTDVYVTMKKDEEDVAYSESYDEKLEKLTRQVKSLGIARSRTREQELYDEAVETAYSKIEEKRPEIEEEVRAEIEKTVRDELQAKQDEVKADLMKKASMFGMSFENFVGTLSDTVTSYLNPITDEQVNSLVDEQLGDAVDTAIKEAKEEALKEIDIPESKWYVEDRNDMIPGYKNLKDQYHEVDSIANIIPIFFIVIVFLMTSNTMSRMIAEERGEMGTFTSLGFSSFGIICGYMIYVFTATLLGVVSGYFIGGSLLPGFVFECFPLSLKGIEFSFDKKMFFGSMIVALVVMSLVTIISCMKELIHMPSYLMRPVPPKSGRKLLLERVGFIWRHISFSWKITLRNLARYKRRVLMTIIGVGGCTFLMFIGYAIRDCISDVGNIQFDDIHHYDLMVVLDDKVKSFKDIDSGDVNLDNLIVNPLMLRQETLKVKNTDGDALEVYLIVPDEKSDLFEEYFSLKTADPRDCAEDVKTLEGMVEGDPLSLSEEGVLITPRIAKIYDVKPGDEIKLVDADDKEYLVTVDGIAENYVSNYVYMSAHLYRKVFRSGVMFNSFVADRKYPLTGTSESEGAGTKSETGSDSGKSDENFLMRYLRKALEEDSDKDGSGKKTSGNNVSDKNNSGDETDAFKDELPGRLLEADSIVRVSTREYMLKSANEAIKGLDGVVVMLVVISSMLAFTVLYNLTAISISERTREIATLKVLGFSYYETNDYIYRETIISSIVGIAVGLLVAPYLLEIVLDMIAVDNLVFLRIFNTSSYVNSIVLSVIFTLVMMVVTFVRLARIDMIESLKSIE